MNKKIVYIAHPISGDIHENLRDLIRIMRIINMNEVTLAGARLGTIEEYDFSNVIPQAPYYHDIIALDDNNPLERKRGIDNDIAMINTGVYDELWLTGDRISFGMSEEIKLFVKLGKPVLNYIGRL
jgi:hypothetical protein